jgi:hypothetical protein
MNVEDHILSLPVENSTATSFDLYFALVCLTITLISIFFQLNRLIRNTRKHYKMTQAPFSYVITIYVGLLLVIINELIILITIILSDQTYTFLGREKSILIIMGLGFFIFGWSKLAIFNLSLGKTAGRIIGIAFLSAMVFYVFALTATILIVFDIIETRTFIGLGYETAVSIYGTILMIDILAILYIAIVKIFQSKYQSIIGLLLFTALFLNFLSIIFNVIPLLILDRVEPSVHIFFNYIVEPFVYMVATHFSLLFLYWVLFNPNWLKSKIIEKES